MGEVINTSYVQNTKKEHECFGCEGIIKKNSPAFKHAVLENKKMESVYFCLKCGWYSNKITEYHLANGHSFKHGKGCFKEHLIPNKVRKMFAAFLEELRVNPNAEFVVEESKPTPPKELKAKHIVVSKDDLAPKRRILWLPAKNFKLEDFPAGRSLRLRAGVCGQVQECKVKIARAISRQSSHVVGMDEPLIGVAFTC